MTLSQTSIQVISDPRPTTLDQFVEMFDSIYGVPHNNLSLEHVGFHLGEEVGEVANAIRIVSREIHPNTHGTRLGLEGEIADVFSWLCMLFIKLRKLITSDSSSAKRLDDLFSGQPVLLSAVIWVVYADGEKQIRCPGCGHRPCIERVPESAAKTLTLDRKRRFVIAIDGPSGSGKSTIAKLVAEQLQLKYVNTGAMYRAITLLALRQRLSPDDANSLSRLLDRADMEVIWIGDEMHLLVDGEDLTPFLRTKQIDEAVRTVAALPVTRTKLLPVQRKVIQQGGVVMEGRDIGTVVFPNAELKIFLDASPEVRAERRWKEHQEKGDTLTVQQVLEEVHERDKRDRERKVSPLVRAQDAVIVDNTAMDVEETARLIIMLAREREKELAAAAGGKA